MTEQHVFEKAGLGTAPFRFCGITVDIGPHRYVDKSGVMVEVGAPGQPMGTCAYCSTGIAYLHHIKSANGRSFVVGSECVQKTGDRGLIKAANHHRTEMRKVHERGRIEKASRMLQEPSVASQLSRLPHPNRGLSEHGGTLLDYIQWMFERAGHSGKLRVTKIVETLQKTISNDLQDPIAPV